MRKIGKELFTFQKLMKMWLWGYSITNFTTVLLVFDKKKVGKKSAVEKVLPYQTFLREGIPTQLPNRPTELCWANLSEADKIFFI
jgi:hypothetical protein